MGQRRQALDWLERAARARDPWHALLAVDPAFSQLRSEPRFRALIERIGLPSSP